MMNFYLFSKTYYSLQPLDKEGDYPKLMGSLNGFNGTKKYQAITDVDEFFREFLYDFIRKHGQRVPEVWFPDCVDMIERMMSKR